MKRTRSNKINKIRTFALSLVFIGILIMYIGIFFKENTVVMIIAMSLGFLAVLSSTVVYFFIGLLSTKAVVVVCPNCNQSTKVLGRADVCMHCDQPLTMDKTLEGKTLDEMHSE